MSGESPREEKLVEWNCWNTAAGQCQTTAEQDTVMAMTAVQASWQQLAVWAPLGQHEVCESPAGLSPPV